MISKFIIDKSIKENSKLAKFIKVINKDIDHYNKLMEPGKEKKENPNMAVPLLHRIDLQLNLLNKAFPEFKLDQMRQNLQQEVAAWEQKEKKDFEKILFKYYAELYPEQITIPGPLITPPLSVVVNAPDPLAFPAPLLSFKQLQGGKARASNQYADINQLLGLAQKEYDKKLWQECYDTLFNVRQLLLEKIQDLKTLPADKNRYFGLYERIGAVMAHIANNDLFLKTTHHQPAEITNLLKPFMTLSRGTLENYYWGEFKPLRDKQDAKFKDFNVSVLGGANLKVYLLADLAQENKLGEKAIFRIIPDDALASLKAVLSSEARKYITKQYYLKPVSYADYENGKVSDYLQISEFCQTGDMSNQSKNFSDNLSQKQSFALDYLSQLATMLLDLKKEGLVFTDIKPTNFLVNDKNQLVISDLKSIVLTKMPTVKSNFVVTTAAYQPPEQFKDSRETINEPLYFNVDDMQRYQVGLTIYEYLTGQDLLSLLVENKKEHQFDFDHPAFEGEKGQLLAAILKRLTHIVPSERMDLAQVKAAIAANKVDIVNTTFSMTEAEVKPNITPLRD